MLPITNLEDKSEYSFINASLQSYKNVVLLIQVLF